MFISTPLFPRSDCSICFQTPYRTLVQSEFEAIYKYNGIEISERNFWNKPINGRKPQDTLNEKATILFKNIIF